MVFQSYALYPHMTRAREPRPSGSGCAAPTPARSPSAWSQAAARRSGSTRVLDRKPASSRAASGSASRSAGRWCATRRCFCSTSRSRTSTPSSAWRPAPSSRGCTAGSAATIVYVTHDQEEALTLGGPGDGDARRAGGAGRAADGGLPPPATVVRRRIRRLAGDEPARRRGRRDGPWAGPGGLVLAGAARGRAAPGHARRPAARRRDRGAAGTGDVAARVDVVEPRGSELLVHARLGEDGQGQEVQGGGAA